MQKTEDSGILKRVLFLVLGIFVSCSYYLISFTYSSITQFSSNTLDNVTKKLVFSGIWVGIAVIVTIVARQNPLESFRIFTKKGKKEWLLIPAYSVFAFVFGISLNRLITVLLDVLPLPSKMVTEYENATAATISGKNPVIIILSLYVVTPIVEELLFRGKAFYYLENVIDGAWGKVLAILCTSLIFGISHASTVQAVYAVFCGGIFAFLTVKTGSIITSIFAHMGFNLGNVILNAFIVGRDRATLTFTNIVCFVILPVSFAVIFILGDLDKKTEEVKEESIYR